mmetsp:Transcript_18887/g.72785  ORF Transcript_18887/g.72785 Transcript_18887/m.72785 type:complete len:555 (+) Transcript_18887:130-1794(+)
MAAPSDDEKCPHFNGTVKIEKVMKKVFKIRKDGKWKCNECDVCSTTGSLWACLTCAYIGCGRYHSGHAEAHYNKSSHQLSIELQAGACHCYGCDDFVTNDTRHGDMRMFRQMLFEMSCSNFSDSVTRSGRVIHQIGDNEEQQEQWGSEEGAAADEGEVAQAGRKRARAAEPANQGMDMVMGGMLASGLCRNPMALGNDSDVPVPVVKKRKRGRPRRIVDATPGQVGLRNLGNTCFLSSVLQALSNTPLFRIMILSLEDADVCSSSVVLLDGAGDLGRSSRRRNLVPEHVSIALELKKAFKALWSRNGVAYSPDSFLSVVWRILPRFYGYHQQDAHEFLRHMLDRLRTELSETAVSNFIHDTFQGQLLSEVTCLKCHTTSRKHDPFLDLSLVIPSTTDDEPVSLQACLKEYVAAECLEKSEKYVCGHCSNNKEKAMKKFTLEKLPVILCLHLKRFKWTPPTRSKVATMVDFPAELNLAPFCTGARPKLETTYYLYALISHHGEGTGSGHYTSHCFNDDGWYHYNDSCVQQCPFSEVQRQQAYILFYIQATAVEPV